MKDKRCGSVRKFNKETWPRPEVQEASPNDDQTDAYMRTQEQVQTEGTACAKALWEE